MKLEDRFKQTDENIFPPVQNPQVRQGCPVDYPKSLLSFYRENYEYDLQNRKNILYYTLCRKTLAIDIKNMEYNI
jgi:hypothetical protein